MSAFHPLQTLATSEKLTAMLQFLVLVTFSTAAVAAQAPRPVDPHEKFLDRVEAQIHLPAGAWQLEAYSRAYFSVQNGAKVMAIYSTLSPPGRRWVAQNPGPFIMDGGCAVVTVMIDASTGIIEQVECNGVG
jgi:hypothetical protein